MPTGGKEGSLPALTGKQYKRNRRAVRQQTERQHAEYFQREITNPKPDPQKDLVELGFVGASVLHQARQRYVAGRQPRVQAAGPIKPQALPKGFTGFTPAQEKQARKVGATPSGGFLTSPRLGKVGRYPGDTAAALAALAQSVQHQGPQRAFAPVGKKETEASVGGALVKETAKSLYKDVTDFRAGNLLLDALAFGSLGVSGAARGSQAVRAANGGESIGAALRAKPVPSEVLPKRLLPPENPEVRSLAEPLSGTRVQLPNQSRNVMTAGFQHALDRLSEAHPHLPGLGSVSRLTRRIPELQATRQTRLEELGIPLARAGSKLKGFRGTTPAEAAFTTIARYGHTGDQGVHLLNMEIKQRVASLSSLKGIDLERQLTRIRLLQAARPLVKEPTPEILNALQQAKRLTEEQITPMRKAREFKPLTEKAAEEAPAHHIRLVHGAEFVTPTKARLGIASPAEVRQGAYVERLQKAFDRSLAQEAKAPARSMVHRELPEGGIAARSSRTERLGASLSVEKEKFARMQAASAKRVEPTGLVGFDHLRPGPLGFFTTDRAERRALRTLLSLPSRKGITPPLDTIRGRTGATFRQAREQLGPQVTYKDYLREVGVKGHQADSDLAYSFSREFNRDQDAGAVLDGTLHLYNPERVKVPEGILADAPEIEIESMTPNQIAKRLLQERKEVVSKMFPASEELVPAEQQSKLRVIDPKIAEAIQGLTLYQNQVAGTIARIFDGINNAERFLLIYANPAYGPVQRTANYAYLALLEGLEFPTQMRQNAKLLGQLSDETNDLISMEVGGGAAQSLAHEAGRSQGVAPVRQASERLTDYQQYLADSGPRKQAWVYEARKYRDASYPQGFNSPTEIDRLFVDAHDGNEAAVQALNIIGERSQQAMVKFRRTPTKFRRNLSKVIFILPWLEGSTRYVGRLMLDRPLTARVSQEFRERIKKQQNKVLEGGETAVRGFIPIRKLAGFNPQGMSPFATPADLAQIAKGLVTGKDIAQGLNVGSILQPAITAGIETGFRYNTYGGYQYPSSLSRGDILRENLIGSVERPVTGIGATIATALRKPEPLSGPASKQPSYLPEAGLGAALERLFLGSARPRTPNKPADIAKARKLQRAGMSAEQRSQDDGKKMLTELTADARAAGLIGPRGQQPPIVKKAIRLRTQRYTNYAKTGAKTQQEKLRADVKQLVSQGKMPRTNISITDKFLATNPSDREVEHQRDLIGREFYLTDVLTQARAEIRAATERTP